MFCIAAFIILAIISIFSAGYRRTMKKAWGCVVRKVTLRPCDTNFKNEIKDKMLSHVAVRTPRLVKAADVAIEVAAWAFIILTVWSLCVAVKSGLNLFVYGTCNPANASSCSLGSEACSIESYKPSFYTSVKSGTVIKWAWGEASGLGETVSNIPTRLQTWNAEEYAPNNASYYKTYDLAKPTALEIIDPGCQFCQSLYQNQKNVSFADRYNLTYIAYPIKDEKAESGYKFPNSQLVVTYLEAMRLRPLPQGSLPADWYVLDKIYTGTQNGVSQLVRINTLLNANQTKEQLRLWMKEAGYGDEQIKEIEQLAASDQVNGIIEANRSIVEDEIRTVKIPTIIYDGRRRDGAQSEDSLR